MKYILIVVGAFLLSSCATNKQAEIEEKEQDYTAVAKTDIQVSGKVVNELGQPLAFAKVMLIQEGAVVCQVNAGFEGEFNMDTVVAGVYDLEVNMADYQPNLIEKIKIKDDKVFNIQMNRTEIPQVISLKPIIYLYPEKEMDISVSLAYKGELTHTYPKYSVNGWKVTAQPDGTLFDANGKEYYALFWEGKPTNPIQPKSGFVIPGNETISFLEEKLAYLGLNRREANEFIMFWLPQMENNPFNLIHFSSDAYEDLAVLAISPKPETIIRLMMITKPSNVMVELPLQDISDLKKERKGFTAVEWGGMLWPGEVVN